MSDEGFWLEDDAASDRAGWRQGPNEYRAEPSALADPDPALTDESSEPEADPAAVIVAWLRRGFDGLHLELERTAVALDQQRADLLQLAESQGALIRVADSQAMLTQAVESQSSELNVSLAELEGCAAQLRNEAASLQSMRSDLADGVAAMLLDIREALATELPALVNQAVQPAIGAAVSQLLARIDGLPAEVQEAVRAAAPPAVAPEALPAEPMGSETPGDAGVQLPVAARRATSASTGAPPPPRPDPVPPTSPDAEPSAPTVPEPEPPPPMADPSPEPRPDDAPATAGQPQYVEAKSSQIDEIELEGTEVTCAAPGLAVGPSFAVSITRALERARLRRRRRRLAGTPRAGLHRRDPYAGDATRRLEKFALARSDRVFEKRSSDAMPELRVAAGEYGGNEFAIDLGVLGCLCLLGANSSSVARSLVVSLLAQPARAQAQVFAVGQLLPDNAAAPGLVRFEGTREALDRLEPEVAGRAKRLADDGSDSVATYNRRHPEDPITPLLVATPRLAAPDGPRLRALVADAGRLGIAAVLVDAVLDGSPTLQLKSGGVVEALQPEATLGGLVGARLFLLAQKPAQELLSVVAEAGVVDEASVTDRHVDEQEFVVPDPPGEVPIQVQLLGPYRIDAAGKEIRSGLRAKARELLAFYLLHPEGTTLDTATEALWPEADAGRGSEWFWTALGNLRSLLRGATGLKELKVIERDGDIYKVEPIFDVDLWRLEQALAEAGTNGDDDASELLAECLQRAADLYSGELLEGADWAWADIPREDLRRRAVDVLVASAANRSQAGDVHGALDVLQHAVDVDPYAEQVYRRIMRLHAQLARPDAVTATYRSLETRLKQVNLEPLPHTGQLFQELTAAT